MGDVITVGGAFAGLKGAYEIAKSMMGIRDAVMIQSKVVELLGEIMAAQEGALRSQERESALTQQIRELEQRIKQMETWDREKDRYELKELPPGVFVRALKRGMEQGKPAHCICEKCYQNGKRSILHKEEPNHGLIIYFCQGC